MRIPGSLHEIHMWNVVEDVEAEAWPAVASGLLKVLELEQEKETKLGVLLFMPSKLSIKRIQTAIKGSPQFNTKFTVFPLFSGLSSDLQVLNEKSNI